MKNYITFYDPLSKKKKRERIMKNNRNISNSTIFILELFNESITFLIIANQLYYFVHISDFNVTYFINNNYYFYV